MPTATPSPSDIAVLIPSYGRADLTRRAVESALACGAGEVIVSEDASGEDMSALEWVEDSRYRFVSQNRNLGLWRNHLTLLGMTAKKWIKFLQTDDHMAPDCLRTMCAAVGTETTLVSMLPVYRELDTSKVEYRYRMEASLRSPAGTYVDRMAKVGNESGRPSYTLFRRDALLEIEEAWRNDMSCDLVANVIAAAKGEVVLLPPGLVTCGIHKGRDGATQSFDLLARRLVNSLTFLGCYPDARIRRFAAIYGIVESIGLVRVFLGRHRKGQNVSWRRLATHLYRLVRAIEVHHAVCHPERCVKYLRHKYMKERPICVGKT